MSNTSALLAGLCERLCTELLLHQPTDPTWFLAGVLAQGFRAGEVCGCALDNCVDGDVKKGQDYLKEHHVKGLFVDLCIKVLRSSDVQGDITVLQQHLLAQIQAMLQSRESRRKKGFVLSQPVAQQKSSPVPEPTEEDQKGVVSTEASALENEVQEEKEDPNEILLVIKPRSTATAATTVTVAADERPIKPMRAAPLQEYPDRVQVVEPEEEVFTIKRSTRRVDEEAAESKTVVAAAEIDMAVYDSPLEKLFLQNAKPKSPAIPSNMDDPVDGEVTLLLQHEAWKHVEELWQQDGPSCAAASVANMWNFLTKGLKLSAEEEETERRSYNQQVPHSWASPSLPEHNKGWSDREPPSLQALARLTQYDVLVIYRDFIRIQISKTMTVVSQKLSYVSMTGFKDLLPHFELVRLGNIKGKAQQAVFVKNNCIRQIQKIIRDNLQLQRDALDVNPELTEEEKTQLLPAISRKFVQTLAAENADVHKDLWNALYSLCLQRFNLAKLSRPNGKSSTGPIGNWGLIKAANSVLNIRLKTAYHADSGIKAVVIVKRRKPVTASSSNNSNSRPNSRSASPRGPVPSSSSSNIATSDQTEGESVEFTPPTNPDQPLLLSAGDDVKTKLLQWEHLAHLLMDPHRYLIYHLKNHYATIFGLREITAEDGTVKRQILCARKAQLPKHWIDWTEVHRNISTSRTYCIMGFRRLVPPPVQEEASIE